MSKSLELKIIMSATDKASAAFKKLRSAGDVLGQTLDKLEGEMKGYERAQARLTQRVQLTAKIKEQTKAPMAKRKDSTQTLLPFKSFFIKPGAKSVLSKPFPDKKKAL